MTQQHEQLQNLAEIRNLMERSSRFLSLSGLSGISAGICALIGAAFAYFYLDNSFYWPDQISKIFVNAGFKKDFLVFFFVDAFGVLISACLLAFFFSYRKAKRNNWMFWDKTAWLTIINLAIPLATGGAVCLILVFVYYQVYLIAAMTLIFYGLALLNASKYTLTEIRYLGLSEIVLGIIAAIFPGYGLVFWTLGFGILHIIYGIVMYYKYERDNIKSK